MREAMAVSDEFESQIGEGGNRTLRAFNEQSNRGLKFLEILERVGIPKRCLKEIEIKMRILRDEFESQIGEGGNRTLRAFNGGLKFLEILERVGVPKEIEIKMRILRDEFESQISDGEVRRGGLNSLKIVGYQKETEMKMGMIFKMRIPLEALVVEFELQSADGGIRTLCALNELPIMEQSHRELNLLKKFGIQKFELQITDGGQSYRGLNFVESVGVQARRIQFSPQDLRDVLSGGGGDDDSSSSGDEDSGGSSDDDSSGSNGDDSGGGSSDEDDNGGDEDGGGDGGDDEFYGFDLNGDDSDIVKKVVGEELIFTTEEVEKLAGAALGSDFQMIILSDKSYAARSDSMSTNLGGGVVIISHRLAGPVWDDHMKDYLRVNSIVHEVHFGKTDDDFEEDVWCLYC